MGGGKGSRRKFGKSNPNHDGESSGRKPIFSGGRFPAAALSSFIHQESTSKVRLRDKAFGYIYPESTEAVEGAETSNPAFVNQDLIPDQAVEAPSYEYHPSIVGGFALGYHGETADEEEEDVATQLDEDEMMDGLDFYSTPVICKSKFLTIGGVKICTEDCSSHDEGEYGLDSDGEGEEPGTEGSDSSDSEEGEEEDESDGSSEVDSCSEIDEELAEDYLEGIGGSSELLKSEWLAKVKLGKSDTNSVIRRDGLRAKRRGVNKLGGIALMNASKEYGMQKPRSGKGKGNLRAHQFGSPIVDIDLLGLDDLSFAKDTRTGSGKRKKKQKQQPPLSRSWPGEARKNTKYGGFSGGKKKHRKELIAVKRRQRMLNRGVDLDQINQKLREMVINEGDMFAFQPMHSRDCSQIQRLASIYQLQSGCQGSGKKRFVTVTRTKRTALPGFREKDHLDKLLGAGTEDDDDFVIKGRTKGDGRLKSTPHSNQRSETCYSAPRKPTQNKNSGTDKKQASRLSYAKKPIAFVSCGVIQTDFLIEATESQSIQTEVVQAAETSSSKLGAFEMHTTGFGSRMLAKMGFVEGSGLGKSGQGMVHPIEPIKRPKSLGLGVEFVESATEEVRVEKGGGIGSFERHTKGFGSRMMTKMGFTPGSGLGKDAQGMVNPLTTVRRPKCRGLGST